MPRAVLLWLGIGVLLIASLAAAIGALNRDVYSANGFVRDYLEAIERQDARTALSLPGVQIDPHHYADAGLPVTTSTVLLRNSMIGEIDDVRFVSDVTGEDGIHTVTVEYTLETGPASSSFRVEQNGTIWGVLPTWRFVDSPLAHVDLTVLHASIFEVNGLTLDTRTGEPEGQPVSFNNSASYLAFAPGVYTFSHESSLLTAEKQDVAITDWSAPTEVSVDTQANADFVDDVQEEVDGYLDDCATQTVLQPAGCPFGIVIDDRIKGEPAWSIAEYPVVTIVPGETGWLTPPTPAAAHIVVEVQSLFDGDVTTLDQDEPFELGLDIAIEADGSINIQVQ
ncbi:hypothetical protein CLV54_0373 [Compostimonas suwonensis]|uniref:Uncharacterized protein n=2 Tax=Compostimonas suwonensis TaxID=1048394 RepID=A0A2M9C481_9MICO|nr:hypothetical protein CLV54_0373 [Compostimonas suwonensis]